MHDKLISALQELVDESEGKVTIQKEDAAEILKVLKGASAFQKHLHDTMLASMVAGKALEMATTGTENGYVGQPKDDLPENMYPLFRGLDKELAAPNVLSDNTTRKAATSYFVRWLKVAVREQESKRG